MQERFSDKFLEKSAPDKKSILHLVEKFNMHGTVWNLPYERSKIVSTLQMLATLEKKLMADPGPLSKSLCRVVKQEKLSYSAAYHSTVALNFHPYCVHVHELLPLEFKQYVNYHSGS